MFGAFDIDSLHYETRCLIRRVMELTGENERDAVHRAMAQRYERLTGAGLNRTLRYNVSASELCRLAGRKLGYEAVLEAIAKADCATICVSEVRKAATYLRSTGVDSVEQTLQNLIVGLNLTVLPFTANDWRAAPRRDHAI
jgi:hypothetical protein